jgi:fructose/tagatose bisphosphate aldolase
MNIDTDTQWSFWDGIREYEAKNHDYLQAQIGNPDGADKPNKKYYDPRMPLRAAEEATVERLGAPRRVNQFFCGPRRASSPRDESTHRLVCTQARRWRT